MVSSASAVALLREGIAAARAGDKALTRRLLREATELEPDNEVAWLWLAGVAGSPQDSVECLRRVLEINPANDRAREGLKSSLLQAGIASAKTGEKEDARQFFRELTDHDPKHEMAWLWLGGVAGSPEEAVECLRHVLEINPANDRAREGLKSSLLQAGITAAKAGQKEEAHSSFKELVELDPRHEAGWLWLASVCETAQEALAAAQHVLEINPRNERAREEVARRQAELKSATPAWECPLCNAGSHEALHQCGECGALVTLDDVEQFFDAPTANPTSMRRAIEHYEDAVIHEVIFENQFALGLAYANLQDWESASECFAAAVTLRAADRNVRAQINAFINRVEAKRAEDDAARDAAASAVRRILVVDDSPTVRKVVSLTLEKQGFEVLTAVDGYAATDSLGRMVPDLILLDINMPGMDGYQVCKLVKEHPDTANVPVVMLSGKDGFFDKIRGKLAGATAYITKPFNPVELVQAVEKHCLKG